MAVVILHVLLVTIGFSATNSNQGTLPDFGIGASFTDFSYKGMLK